MDFAGYPSYPLTAGNGSADVTVFADALPLGTAKWPNAPSGIPLSSWLELVALGYDEILAGTAWDTPGVF